MIQHGILDLDAIYDMLGPEDSLIQEDAEKDISEAREFIRKMNIVSTKDKEENEDKQQENEVDDDINGDVVEQDDDPLDSFEELEGEEEEESLDESGQEHKLEYSKVFSEMCNN